MNKTIKFCLLFVIIPFFALAWFAHPTTDDFCHADRVARDGFWASQLSWFHTTNGFAYTAFACDDLYVAATHPFAAFFSAYKLVPLATLALLFLSIWSLLGSVASTVVNRAMVFWGAIAVLALFLTRMPTPAQGIYWLVGANAYTLGPCLLALLLAALCQTTSAKRNTQVVFRLSCIALTVALLGAHIPSAALALVVITVGTVAATWGKWSTRKLWWLVLAVALLFAVVGILTPGNRARSGGEEAGYIHHFDPVRGLAYAALAGGENVITWALDPALLSAGLLFLVFAPLAWEKYPTLQRVRPRDVTGYLLLTVITVVAVYFPVCVVTGESGVPHRQQNVAFFFYLFAWFGALVYGAAAYRNTNGRFIEIPSYLRTGAVCVLAISLVVQGNFIQAVKDLLTRAPRYHAQLTERYQLIRKAVALGEQHITVPELVNPPPTIYKGAHLETGLLFRKDMTYKGDITDDPKDWRNVCYAKFWGVDSIVTAPNPRTAKP